MRSPLLRILLWLPVCAAQYRAGEPNGDVPNGEKGLFPHLINLAARARITANATCGESGPEVYCKLTEHSGNRAPQCGVCDSRSPNAARRHPVTNAIDGSSSWWQSPMLAVGRRYEWVTITLDLRQVYRVAYIIVKSAISPRPGNWILERSIDGRNFEPWQYYALSDAECISAYGIQPTPGRPTYATDTQVICTSYFSRLNPLEGGEIHTSLVNGRPGYGGPSEALRKFTEARYVRLRLQKIRTLHGELQGRSSQSDTSVTQRYFYSIKDISIGGHCVCNGHADNCESDNDGNSLARCSCVHNTCGDTCDKCCPLFNQQPWRAGNNSDGGVCEKCQCHGHAQACRYDEEVASKRLSVNIRGEYEGGGVCLDCEHNTEGVNCERCQAGFYRPQGVPVDAPRPCLPCDCSGPGSTGRCVQDDTQLNLGLFPGACICKDAFDGPRCDRCAKGYRRYPECEPCPCDRAGSINEECDGECICKPNVRGPRCDSCAPGHFHLDARNPVGCTPCFCNGATSSCGAARLAVYTVVEHGNWHATDLLRRRVVAALQEGTDVHIAHDDMANFETYYWLAPDDYLGRRVTSYGQTLTVRVSWVRLRGDTSGRPTRCPDVIIEGAGYRIAYGDNTHRGRKATLEIPLYEHGWFHFSKDISDITASTKTKKYRGAAVTRREMMEILSSVETLMIRARYHTVQIEGVLHNVMLEYGAEGTATLVTGAVERCNCPPGYTGLSCESCEPGYRRVNNTIYGGECRKCNCNGHVEYCDPFTGACGDCQHNTVGVNCERCAAGYFGDATLGTPDACQACACPLTLGDNHFTPRCVEDPDLGGYKCQCPAGYSGPRCETCADGYFGNPLVPGNFCKQCDCNGNIDFRERDSCDRHTGQCLKCTGNTAGWHCERCKDNHYGDAKRGQCIRCACHPEGSLSTQCDPENGQCQCKPLYTGRQCDRCISGHGGVREGCPSCQCHPEGSSSPICDPFNGQCPCKPGVAGRYCNECLPNHFGDLSGGCSRCECDELGSTSSTCDIVTGQCSCKPNVIGRTCSSCKPGYWGHVKGAGCLRCDCDKKGSISPQCDDATGQCRCRPGVGGPRCDSCLPGYWGFSRQGCKPCDRCSSPGHFCDPTSGRCICPQNTEGDRCERCSPGSWDYDATHGCKLCNCSGAGAITRQCDARTGHCVCKEGYEGNYCGKCKFGFFGYPLCTPCNCNMAGTNSHNCDSKGRCQCDDNGQCPCKSNVEGRQCGKCVGGTFGLSVDNPNGCTSCYCFRRTDQCTQADLTWSQLRMLDHRVLNIEYRRRGPGERPFRPPVVVYRPWNTQEICYINLALPGERLLSFGEGESKLNVTNQLHVIPGIEGNVKIGSNQLFDAPLYWQLPREFMRDKVRSYNGHLRFRVHSEGGTRNFPEQILQTYPLVSLQGNWQLVLEYYPPTISPDGRYKVKLHEDYWRLKNKPQSVTREMMMIALQNIQHILIRATHAADATTASLHDVSMDIAAEGSPVSSRVALGVEQCFCPKSYSGTSCQNPNIGFYRWYKDNHIQSTIIIDLVGESRPCRCNGRSETCDSETGVCKNCRENTMGPNCEVCATGYYGDPAEGPCKPCACPSREQNFAETCQADRFAEYICHCRVGYTGDKCDRCDFGYYGRPTEPGGSCKPCDCDPFGSLHEGCDADGMCSCKPGITGRDCSQCAPRHVTSESGCKSCEDGCVNVLLDELDEMIAEVTSLDVDGYIPAPWPSLREIQNVTKILRFQLNRYHSNVDTSQEMVINFDLDYYAKDLIRKAELLEVSARETYPPTAKIKADAQSIMDLLKSVNIQLEETIAYLKNYAIGETPSISIGGALMEAEKILREIQMRNFSQFDDDAEVELQKARILLERITKMVQKTPVLGALKKFVKDIREKLNEMTERLRTSNEKVDEAAELNLSNTERLARVKNYSVEIKASQNIIHDQNFNSTQLNRESDRNLRAATTNYDDLLRMLADLRNSTNYLEEYEGTLWRLNNEYSEKYVKRAHDHAMELLRESIRLESLFNKTRDVADGPLRAAQAYQRIVDALLSAREAARNASHAAQTAYKVAYPGDPDNSLVRRAALSLDKSEGLRTKGESLHSTLRQQLVVLDNQQKVLAKTGASLSSTDDRLIRLNAMMDMQLTSGISADIDRSLERIATAHDNVQKTFDHVTAIHGNLTIIKERALELNRIDTSLLNEVRETITKGESNTMKGVRLASNLQKTVGRIETRFTDLSERIEALKRKIKQTRQHASSIRVSLTTNSSGICTRKYKPALQPSTTTNIVLSYAIQNRTERNALLLYLGSHNSSDFMAVEMVNRKIEFIWDAGGGAKRIVHPLRLQTNDPQVSDDTKWYHITINRIGNIGQLTVLPANVPPGETPNTTPVSDASPAGFSKMDLLPTDTLWIGGVPARAQNVMKAKKFAGCLHTVFIDGENIGLWNFTESEGCGACNEGMQLALRQTDDIAVGFNGKGYFKGTNRIRRPKQYYSTVLAFKTLDEDALLFLAVNEAKNQYFSLSLDNGHVVFIVQFDSQTRLVMKSSKKYNNNEMIQIQAIVQNKAKAGERMGRLMVGDQDQLGTVKGGPDLDLSYVPYYFGGVDPEFDRDRWGNELVLRSLLGCMGRLSVLDEGKNPLTDGQFYGIENTCAEKVLNEVGFLGHGFVELASHVLKRESNFGFTFQTMEADALLMLSTFVGQDNETDGDMSATTTTTTTTPTPLQPGEVHPPDFYSVSLVEGHLDIQLNGGAGIERIMSAEKFNDGQLHSISVIKENRRVTLKVDDREVNSTRLDRGGQVVSGPNTGGLYFGGAPPGLDIVTMVGSASPMKGCIRDVIVNNKVLPFNQPIQFQDVYIGRCADIPATAMQGMEGDMKVIDSCMPPTQHTVEYRALKFGDQIDSHVMVPLHRNTLKNDFNISFEFRTYYPNGLFFIASHTRKKQTQTLSAQLRNGRVVITMNRRKRANEIVSNAGLNTGHWRKVIIRKAKKRLWLTVDNQLIKKVKAPRKLNVGQELFLGGLPSNVVRFPDMQTETLRGCLRNLNINEEEFEIPSNRRLDRIVGVGQCFASVQPGSYFPGDAYAVYSNNFNVGALLELGLEFRTWELNGIILTVADPRGTSLSLEMVNGAVVLSVDMGVGHSFSARVSLKNKFSLCDNKWHTVKANYVKDSLTLRVDKHREAYGFNGSNNEKGTVTDAPLYIGGLPESALQGTLATRENFKGCIRNIVMNSERRDWTDMFQLQNVLLNACPVL